MHDCILTNNEDRIKKLNPCVDLFWRDLHVRSDCVCIDEKIAIPNGLRETLIDDLHASQPGTWGKICMTTHCWWLYMNNKLIVRSAECKPCTTIGKNLKSKIPAKQFYSHIPCAYQNQETQIDFGGAIFEEKGHKTYFLAAIDHFSEFHTACIFQKTNVLMYKVFWTWILKIKKHHVPFVWIKQNVLWDIKYRLSVARLKLKFLKLLSTIIELLNW